MKVLGIIPARGGSKGVPRKNIKLLGNQPLISYTINQALNSKYLSKVIVSTDDEEISEVAKSFGAEVPFMRPKELANDTASSLSVVLHAIEFLENIGENYDAVCLLQPTCPFREESLIDRAITEFSNKNSDALVSVLKVPHEYNPHWTFETDGNGLLKISTGEDEIIKRRQDLPNAFFRDGAIYITQVSVIKSNSLYGNKLAFIENNPMYYVNIDTLEDWEKAELIYKKFLK